MIEIKCKLSYDPVPLTGNAEKMSRPWWMIATIDGEMTDYYAWFLKKRTGIVLQRPAWGAHISVIRGEEPVNKELWKKHEQKEVNLLYDIDLRTNGDHWWMRVFSRDLLDVREELGLFRFPQFAMHLTLGRPTPKTEETSKIYHSFFENQNQSTGYFMRDKMVEKIQENLKLPPLDLKHKELKRTGDSAFRSECPHCQVGILFVQRDPTTFKLLKDDCCTYCGRRVIYTDMEENVCLVYKS